MTPFDWHKNTYPKAWSEVSFDFRLLMVWHASMMVLMVLSAAGSNTTGLLLSALLAGLLALLSLRYQRAVGWRWPGVRAATSRARSFMRYR
jgi:hypothetical protein